jgi:hypothetical protein
MEELHNEELHNLYSSPSIISQKEGDHKEDQELGGWIILERILKR